ncbi:MAG: hypothetical protein EBY22_08255 [Gammaproteobacteria bacterium]|nr:hypothetical protein [Gammaproteobacteria bacterium]
MLENQIKSLEHQERHTLAENRFIKDIINRAANACNNINNQDFDVEKARKQSENDFIALNVEGGLQALVAAQMMAIHKLQQTSMALAKGLPYGESSQYYTNTSIKLSNTFIQQATLLAKLQGGVGQKITVERVDISHGGQAVIGTVNGGSST